jgi:ferredoxin
MATAPTPVTIHWPNGHCSSVVPGQDWLLAAREAGMTIPTGCLGGSCGACEIDVNGQTVRACIATVPASRSGTLTVELASDPYW